jgi:signal recognition particle subunit SRP14|mmetsp:Transcript_7557/g.13620  ORF Transcript_7557/g.13620 Transcript_7557/m.13620 type:complete len:103 (-) Transcript_7557:426-734(-)
MVLLSNDEFLNELHKLYTQNKEKGSVYVTMKRSAMKPKTKRFANMPEEDHVCLIRATDGKRKFSTTLGDGDNAKFQASYHTILKAHMDALKKKDKKGKSAKK